MVGEEGSNERTLLGMLQLYTFLTMPTFLYTAPIRVVLILIPTVIQLWKYWWRHRDCTAATTNSITAYKYPFHCGCVASEV